MKNIAKVLSFYVNVPDRGVKKPLFSEKFHVMLALLGGLNHLWSVKRIKIGKEKGACQIKLFYPV